MSQSQASARAKFGKLDSILRDIKLRRTMLANHHLAVSSFLRPLLSYKSCDILR
jgi:hypothetical protein